jgi:DNA-binding response OmpR family regulator
MSDKNAKILIIDDSKSVRNMLDHVLTLNGFDVILAVSGEEGVEKATSEDPDIILMDVMMPGMNGHETTKIIRENPRFKTTPIIFLSAKDRVYDKTAAFLEGADDYIIKPVDHNVLTARLHRWVDRITRTNSEKEQACVDTVSQLMITLAHHINNSLTVMNGTLSSSDTKNLDQVDDMVKVFEKHITTIGAVVESLVEMATHDEIFTMDYAFGEQMLDITNRLDGKLKTLLNKEEK